MIDPIQEQLSAFLDGELSAAESELLLKRIERAPELKGLLERYVLAGEALRATAVQARPSNDFTTRIAAAIESESMPGRVRLASQWLKPVAGGAIAAGVAAVALVSFQMAPTIASRDMTQSVEHSAMVTSTPDAAAPLVAGQVGNSDVGGASYIVPLPARQRAAPPIQVINNGRLANFVVAHSEYSSPLGRRNMLTGLVAEDRPADQPVEQFIVEQLAGDDAAPAPVQPPLTKESVKHKTLSSAPR